MSTEPTLTPKDITDSIGTDYAAYGWIIVEDHIDGRGASGGAVGVSGPRNACRELLALLEHGEGRTFTMHDDDGEKYYTGRILSFDGPGSEFDFGPLDDYGMPNAGCTEIRYNGKIL
jgi:hypothetical protein